MMLNNIELDRPLAILDLETTGTRTDLDRIVEISIRRLSPGVEPDHRTVRVNPGVPISPEATLVHGIGDGDVAGMPSFGRIAVNLAGFLEGCDLCGFNLVNFDLRMLVAEFRRAGVPFSLVGRRVVDVYKIYISRERRDLSSALRFYCDREHAGAHGAEADVLATQAILDAQVLRYDDLPRTIAELHEHLCDPDAVDFEGKFKWRADGVVVFNFSNDHKDRPVDEVARTHPGFLRWMLTKDFMEDALDIARDALKRAGEPYRRLHLD
jgi:DNA polymerase-3 subunit epsilon